MKDKKKEAEQNCEKNDISGQVGVTIEPGFMHKKICMPNLPKPLSIDEKKYLLAVERGDLANVRRVDVVEGLKKGYSHRCIFLPGEIKFSSYLFTHVSTHIIMSSPASRILHRAHRKKNVQIDCVDPLGRGALTLAIDSENLEMVELLVVLGVQTKDSLLQAIDVGFVEAVELLLEHEELVHKDEESYSWEKVDWNTATFTPDITPLILAAHRNNYEILKILLDRGATLPMPHEIRCGCEECIKESNEDSLRHSRSRINEYKALASPSLIALSSSDPMLSAFELSWDLRNLAFTEQESKAEYLELRRQCQQFAVDLLSQARSSQELAIILNHDPESPPYEDGEHMKLARLELAITYKQKKFVAHPNIQQLLATMWYDGLPGFRRKSASAKLADVCSIALLFPFYCTLYLIAPNTATGKLMRKPFMKFLIHASSYLFFLLLLILVSQRVEDLVIEIFGSDLMRDEMEKQEQTHRGHGPKILEIIVGFYVVGFIWEETVEIWTEGIQKYLKNLWNFIDFTRNSLYVGVFILRVAAYWQQVNQISADPNTAYIPREQWDPFDPQLIAEGLFAAANVFSALKLVHLFSINPHLGPLQISLGRMVIDIVKFFFIYSLVLFAFACGLNQLLWYFAELERRKCYSLPGGLPDWENKGDSCSKWRSFGNLFESTQSLFWASFGGVGTDAFQLTGIKTYTRFWGLLMFGSYSVINVIVLLNLLIAMMSNSYAMIDEHSDTEWKFARTKLWLSYFEESATLPPPFNIIPTPKMLLKFFGLRKKDKMRRMSTKRKEREEKERDYRYTAVMRSLVWRYISGNQRHADDSPVTEDDVNEVKTEISAMKCEILNVLHRNGMDISSADATEKTVLGKKMKIWERRLMKDFHVAPVAPEEEMDFLMREPPADEDVLSKFRRIAKLAVLNSAQQKWGQVIKGACKASQIGHCNSREAFRNQQSLQKAMAEAQKLVCRSPKGRPRSPSPANVSLPETTGSSIMELLQDFSKETESPETRKRITGKQSLLDIQPLVNRSKTPSPMLSKPKASDIQSTPKIVGESGNDKPVIIPSVSISPPPASSKPESGLSVQPTSVCKSGKTEIEVMSQLQKTCSTEAASASGKCIVVNHATVCEEKIFENRPEVKIKPEKNSEAGTTSALFGVISESVIKPEMGPVGTIESRKILESTSGAKSIIASCQDQKFDTGSKSGKNIAGQAPLSGSGRSIQKGSEVLTGPAKSLQTTSVPASGRSPPQSPRPDRKSSESVPTDWEYGEEITARSPPLSSSSQSNSSQEALIPPSPLKQVSSPVRLKGQVRSQPKEGWL